MVQDFLHVHQAKSQRCDPPFQGCLHSEVLSSRQNPPWRRWKQTVRCCANRTFCRWNMVMSDLWGALECLRAPQLEVVDKWQRTFTSSTVEISNVHFPCDGPGMRFLDTMAKGHWLYSGIFLPAWSADYWITLLYSTLFIPILPSDTSLVAQRLAGRLVNSSCSHGWPFITAKLAKPSFPCDRFQEDRAKRGGGIAMIQGITGNYHSHTHVNMNHRTWIGFFSTLDVVFGFSSFFAFKTCGLNTAGVSGIKKRSERCCLFEAMVTMAIAQSYHRFGHVPMFFLVFQASIFVDGTKIYAFLVGRS